MGERYPTSLRSGLWMSGPVGAAPRHDGRMSRPTAVVHPLAPWLRARVLALRAATRARNFPGLVELVPGGATATSAPTAGWTYGAERTDHALRVDVLVRLMTDCGLRGVRRVSLVHVRGGRHEPTDSDLGWAAAAGVAATISGVELATAVALSRWGWRDLASGEECSWVRPRARAGAA